MGALFVGGMLGSIIAIIIIAFLVSALFIWIGASWANVPDNTYKKAIMVAISSVVVNLISPVVLVGLFAFGIKEVLFGLIIGLFLPIFIIQGIYNISFGKAFLVLICYIIAVILSGIITSMFFAGGIFALF